MNLESENCTRQRPSFEKEANISQLVRMFVSLVDRSVYLRVSRRELDNGQRD
jgi:hypothetical protein